MSGKKGTRSAGDVDRHIGGRLRQRRLEREMSQEILAERLGITFQQVQKYERGVNRISASRLFDIATVLELPIADFFEGLVASKSARSKAKRSRRAS